MSQKFKGARAELTAVGKLPRGLTLDKINHHVMTPTHTHEDIEADSDKNPTFNVKKRPRATIKKKG